MICLVGDNNYLNDIVTNFIKNIPLAEGVNYPTIQSVDTILPSNNGIFEQENTSFVFGACGCTSPLDSYMYYYNIFRNRIVVTYSLNYGNSTVLYSPVPSILPLISNGYVLFSTPAFGAFLDALRQIDSTSYNQFIGLLSYVDQDRNVYNSYSSKVSLIQDEHPMITSYYDLSSYDVFYLTNLPMDKFGIDSDFVIFRCPDDTAYVFTTIGEEGGGIVVVNFDVRKPMREIEAAVFVNAMVWIESFNQPPV